MSFFAKILARAAAPGIAQPPLARPKGGPMLARLDMGAEEVAQPLRRQAEEEEKAQPLRRQIQGEEEAVQPLRRQAEEEEEAQPLHRQETEEEDVQPLRRQEEAEEDARPIRRQTQGEDEAAQPLRRQSEEEETQLLRRQETEEEDVRPLQRQEEREEAQALRRQEAEEEAAPLRRVTPPDAEGLTAENSPQPEQNSSEPEMPALQALHRAAVQVAPVTGTAAVGSESLAVAPSTPAVADGDAPGAQAPSSPDTPASETVVQDHFLPAPYPAQGTSERPRVTIDQIDVVIHEDAAAAVPASSTADLGRTLKSKYLRGL